VRQRVQLGLAPAPVVLRRPVVRERLRRGELRALRLVLDRLRLGPFRRLDAPAQVDQLRFGNAHSERTNRCRGHVSLRSLWMLYSWFRDVPTRRSYDPDPLPRRGKAVKRPSTPTA